MSTRADTFAELLKRYRVAAGLTQEELADRALLSARTISNLERGIRQAPYKDTVRRLTEALPLEDEDRSRFVAAARPAASAQDVSAPRSHALPAQLTPLVGRREEVSAVCGLLKRPVVRLLTLVGPGGVGKTRVGLQAAKELVEAFQNGVFFVELAAITDPELVLPAVGQTLGINETAGQSFSAYMASKHLLLVLDNFEQVIAAAPQLVELLATAPDLKVLVTSREPLHLAAEHVYPVQPLQLPDPRHLPEASALSQYESAALFIQRAQAVEPSFEVTTANAPAVAEICVRLDGLPLPLELAAARIPVLSPEAMLKRLGERLKLLRGGARDLPARQKTLRDTLDWSHNLLNVEERRLFAWLGVFAGGFTLEAVEAVCNAELDTLASLVSKNLVRREDERFRILETIREYALEQLIASGDEGMARACHASFFEDLAEDAYGEQFERESEWSEELEGEHDNLRAALDWIARTDRSRYLRLAGALGWFWHVHSHLAEGRARLGAALAGTSGGDESRARALAAAGKLAVWQGDISAARPLIEEAISIWQGLRREQEVAFALYDLGWGYIYAGDDGAARRCMEESLELQRSIGQPFLINRAQVGLFLALVSMHEVETVEELTPAALELAQQIGDLRSEHYIHHFRGDCALIRGDPVQAQRHYHRALQSAVELGDRFEVAAEIQGMAMSAAGTALPRPALLLASAADAEYATLGIDYSGVHFWVELLDRYLGQARTELGPETSQSVWEAGQHLALEQATEEALTLSMGQVT